jgi:SagB-type dehydrogenase family enzyme
VTATPERVAAAGARAYHEATKHSWQSVRADQHFLDWDTKPFPFKVYPEAPVVPLPREVVPPAMPALEAVARVAAVPDRHGLDLPALATLLFFAAGLTKKKVYPGGEAVHFRAAASTGALYEIEVYVVAGDVAGLAAGVYHFSPGDFTLRRLRADDWRATLAEAASEPAAAPAAPAVLVLSAITWRNSWKYRARAYRHFFWDAGTMLANLLATATALGVAARGLTGFADGPVNRLLDLDGQREAAVALVPVGTGAAAPRPAADPAPLSLATAPLSSREVDEPLVRRALADSSLPTGAAARAWATAPPAGSARPPEPVTHPLAPTPHAGASLGSVILRRGSSRQFAREPIGFSELSTILDVAVRELPLDADGLGLVDTHLLVHAVDGLPAGAYAFDPVARGVRLLRAGDFREAGGYLCLEQSLGADASVVAFFLADLETTWARYGDRGYRVVNLLAGLYGGRMYLAAYALGLGASGLTFYDDDVVKFFSPDAAGKQALFVTALGRGRRTGRGLPRIEGSIEPLAPGTR